MSSADVLSICNGTLPKLSPKSSPDIVLEQNTVSSFIARAAATSSAPILDCAVSSCSPTLSERRLASRCMMASTCHGLLVGHSPILAPPNSSAACCSWCRRVQQEPPRHQADTQYLACPCWCSDLVVAACATYSAGNAPSEPRGCCC